MALLGLDPLIVRAIGAEQEARPWATLHVLWARFAAFFALRHGFLRRFGFTASAYMTAA